MTAGLLRRHRDFRLLWGSEVAEKLGAAATSMTMPLAAVSLLNASTFQVSLLAAATWLPWLVIGLPAGAWVDRLPRRPIMLCAAAVSLALFLSIRVAAWAGLLVYGWLLAVCLLTGFAAVFFQISYTAYLPTLLATKDLAEGNAKLHGSASAAQITGQGGGGLLVQLAGPVNGLLTNACTFAVSFVCLLNIRHREERSAPPKRPRVPLVAEVRAGLRLVASDRWFRSYTLYGAVANLCLMGYQSILVIFLVENVRLASGTTGALIAVSNVGGIVGAFLARRAATALGTGRATLAFAILVPLPILLVPLTFPGPGMVLCAVGGASAAAAVVANNVIKAGFQQRYCPPDLLGRLYASSSFLNYGTLPIGALLAGGLGTALGVRPAMWILVSGVPLAGLILLCSPIRHHRDLPDQPRQTDLVETTRIQA